MADSKNYYSNNSNIYINKTVKMSKEAKHKYDISKKKEEKYNEEWETKKVNINEVVDKFAPNSTGHVEGYKFVYEGEKYQVVADMVSGSLRIKDKGTNQYVTLDGKPGSRNDTHFKIKKRGEMKHVYRSIFKKTSD